jgi:hypothetical protein
MDIGLLLNFYALFARNTQNVIKTCGRRGVSFLPCRISEPTERIRKKCVIAVFTENCHLTLASAWPLFTLGLEKVSRYGD